jgi:CheY-like chemotaxis protein
VVPDGAFENEHDYGTDPDVAEPLGRPESDYTHPEAEDKLPLVLIVEDNADVRSYMRGYLLRSYRVLEAHDGIEGTEKALTHVPDLVISDVMMPGRDGLEVCKILKLDERTCHIPVILLTAKAGMENRIEGLDTGMFKS